MKLVTYESGRGARAGVLDGESVIDVWDLLGDGEATSLRELLAADRVGDVSAVLEDAANVERVPEAKLLPPIPDPQKIICIGLNYRAHAAEAGLDEPPIPVVFGKWTNALAAPGATVTLPLASDKVDYEAEVAFVIGKAASNVVAGDALAHVAGYTLLNDLSARDLQFATPQWMAGKVFDGAAPCGPALVTPDEAGPHDDIGIALNLNDEEMQSSSTADLIFGVPALIEHLSGLMTLVPGDIVSTGTPSGVGSVRDPRVWLADGDVTVVSSPTLGELETTLRRA